MLEVCKHAVRVLVDAVYPVMFVSCTPYLPAFLPAAEHPKAGLIKNMDKGVLADDGDDPLGRRSKTPNGSNTRKMEAHR